MKPSSRTPEGRPNRCPVCGKRVTVEPSGPANDAPCPHCGHLLWFAPGNEGEEKAETPGPRKKGVVETLFDACRYGPRGITERLFEYLRKYTAEHTPGAMAGLSEYEMARRGTETFPVDRIFGAAVLSAQGPDAVAEMLSLFDDEDSAVRFWAVIGAIRKVAEDPSRENMFVRWVIAHTLKQLVQAKRDIGRR